MMLGGSSQKDPGAPVLKKVSLPGGDGKHVFVPVNKSNNQQMLVKGISGNSPQLVMVRGPVPNNAAPFKGQSVLVPVTAAGASSGKLVSQGSQPIRINTSKPSLTTNSTTIPISQLKSVMDQNKQMILVQSPQSSSKSGPQQILIPAPKGSKGGPLIMVPVSAPSSGQQNVTLLSSNQQSRGSTQLAKTTTASQQQFLKPQNLKSGISLIPVSISSSSQSNTKVSQSGPQIVKIPQPRLTSKKTVVQGPNGPVLIQSPHNPKLPISLPPGTPPNAKTVFIPDSALGSLPKGVQLIPIPVCKKSAIQVNSPSVGSLQGGKVILVPNNSKSTTSKNVVVLGGPGGRPVYSQSTSNPKQTIIRTINSPGITYRNRGASNLPSMLSKPIKPKPVLETSDNFFKTPIEIKPLEEEKDDDLNDVLNALQGGGHVDLVPVNNTSTIQAAEPVSLTPEIEDFGLKIDSVYSLSSETQSLPVDQDQDATQPEESGEQQVQEKKDKEEDERKEKSDDSDSDTMERPSQEEQSDLSKEPLLPEDEPSQSGKPENVQMETASGEEVDMETGDPEDEPGSINQEDPNLMRGDCLQVRLAQQAARQLQEQMRQESERRNLVQSESDEGMANKQDTDEEKTKVLSPQEQKEKEMAEAMEMDTDCEDNPEPNDGESKKKDGSDSDTEIEDNVENNEKGDKVNSHNVCTEKKQSESDTESGKQKSTENDATTNLKKSETDEDIAQKALLAATLNGCEVADEDLNHMFDELISEYLTTPERPKPSVRVRGIDECKAFLEDSPQSLVTTTQPSSQQALNTSLLPRTITQKTTIDDKMKPKQLKTAAGTITLIPVRVQVPGKPGETTIKYIPMKLPADNAGSKDKAPTPQFIKIVPNTSKSNTTQTVPISGTSGGAPKFVRIVSSSAVSRPSLQPVLTSVSGTDKSVLKVNLPSNLPSKSSPTNIKQSAAAPLTSGLSNEDMARAIIGATRNVFGKLQAPERPNVGFPPKPVQSRTPVIINSPILTKTPATLVPGSSGSLLKKVEQASSAGGTPDVPKKKKKKKKKKKWPKTKKCHVLLRRLNMKVIKNSTVNLKRVKTSWLFEAISRQPRREAKRKAAEMEQSSEGIASKRLKKENGESVPKTTEANAPVPAASNSIDTVPLNLADQKLTKAGPPMPNSIMVTKVPNASGTPGQSTLYRIMSQLPQIRPAISGAPRPTPFQIMHPGTVKMQELPSSNNVSGSVVSLLSKSLIKSPVKTTVSASSSQNSTITLKFSCTTEGSASTASLSSPSVSTSSSNMSTILTATRSAPVLSPSAAGKATLTTSPGKSLLPGTQDARKPIGVTPQMPKMPTLVPAGARVVSPGQSSIRLPMPTLQPAPRSILNQGQNIRVPSSVGLQLQQSPPVIRPKPPVDIPAIDNRPPIVIQPTEYRQPSTVQPAASAGASSSNGPASAPQNKKYLLIKTSAGQFLVPVPGSKPGGASGAAGPTSATSMASSTLGNPVQLRVNLPATSKPSTASVPMVSPSSNNTQNSFAGPSKTKNVKSETSNTMPPVIHIKDEPEDTGYDKYDKSSTSEPSKDDVVEDKASDDEVDDAPRVAASVCHKQRIEELKARLREHEEQLLELKRKREDTKKILESLDSDKSD